MFKFQLFFSNVQFEFFLFQKFNILDLNFFVFLNPDIETVSTFASTKCHIASRKLFTELWPVERWVRVYHNDSTKILFLCDRSVWGKIQRVSRIKINVRIEMIIFELFLTSFISSVKLWGRWRSSKNWLEL